MRWSEDGRSFLIATESKFPARLLSQLSTKSYASLIRRLYYYGFHKVGGIYRHDLFIRNLPSSIQPTRRMSYSASPRSSRHNGSTQRGPRYKIIKRKRARESVWEMHGFERRLVIFYGFWNWSPTLTGIAGRRKWVPYCSGKEHMLSCIQMINIISLNMGPAL